MNTLTRWLVVDRHTATIVSKPYASKSRARARADKLDNEYGAYRYSVISEELAKHYERAADEIVSALNDRAQLVEALRELLTLTETLPVVKLGGAVGQAHLRCSVLLRQLENSQ